MIEGGGQAERRGSTAVLFGAGYARKARRSAAETIMAPTEEALMALRFGRGTVRSDGLCPADGTFAGRSGGLPRKRAERSRGHKGAADAADECVPKGDA